MKNEGKGIVGKSYCNTRTKKWRLTPGLKVNSANANCQILYEFLDDKISNKEE
jgi:hypothetical protein